MVLGPNISLFNKNGYQSRRPKYLSEEKYLLVSRVPIKQETTSYQFLNTQEDLNVTKWLLALFQKLKEGLALSG